MQEDQAAALEALTSPGAYPHPAEAIRIIETHISVVYLTGTYAYKVKKSVKFPFLNFSTLELRERACRDELALNRRLAPSLYLEVVGIGGQPGDLRVGGTPTVEFAVKMSQFPAGATAHELIIEGALTADELVALATTVAAFHASLEASAGADHDANILANLSEFEAAAGAAMRADLDEVNAWIREALDRLSGLFENRAAAGFVRECHGDLHLGNIVLWQSQLVPFDCLEFSRPLRTIDVIDETGFLFMDLLAHERRDLAFAFLNRYLHVTGDFDGLSLLRLYVAHRALVRAKVAMASPRGLPVPHTEQHASRYLAVALAQARSPRPVCLITTGLSGSGKTTIARELALVLGAVHVRSDVERKRIHGLKPEDASHSDVAEGIYDPASSEATYQRLAAAADAALSGRVDIIVDATFLNRRHRDMLRSTAARLDANFLILECEAPAGVLRSRITARSEAGGDASEADLAVLEQQLMTADRLSDDEKALTLTLDTAPGVDLEQLAIEIRKRSAQPSLSSTSY